MSSAGRGVTAPPSISSSDGDLGRVVPPDMAHATAPITAPRGTHRPTDGVLRCADDEEREALQQARRGPVGRARSAISEHHERRLARRLARRDAQALAEVHELTGRAAFSVILGIVRDRGYAEDVHQQVFAEVWRRADQFDPARGTLLTWVLTIARSRALDHVRRRGEDATDPEVLAALGGAQEDRAYDDLLDRALVGEALSRIPAHEREVLRLRFWEGLSQTEIATRTGTPLGTVKSRMLSGLRNLKLELGPEAVA